MGINRKVIQAKREIRVNIFRISEKSELRIDTNRGRGIIQNAKKLLFQRGTSERIESETTKGTSHLPGFHTSTSPTFHVVNIQKLLTKREVKHEGIVIKEIEKIKFLREMCKEEKPYFLAFAETWLNDKMKEAEYEIEGYSHVASHRKNREGGGTIVYIDNGATYKPLVSVGDGMCSFVAVHLEDLNLILFMVYRPPPEQ